MQVDKISREYHVKSYECDRNGTLRLLTLMNIFRTRPTLMLRFSAWE